MKISYFGSPIALLTHGIELTWSVHYFSYTFVFEYLGLMVNVENPDLLQGKTSFIGY